MNSQIITKEKYQRLKSYLRFVFILCILGILSGFIWIKYPAVFTATSTAVENHVWQFRLFRWLIIGIFLISWPFLVEWLGSKMHANSEQKNYWKSEVVRVAIWLILFELLICENIIFKLIHKV